MIVSFADRLARMHRPEEAGPEGGLAPIPLPPLEFRQADDWPTARQAFGLVYENYRSKGLIAENGCGLRYTHFNLLPETATFVACAEGETVATFSLVIDSRPFGLPMDSLYGQELGSLRTAGRKVAEISGLAVDSRYRPISIHLIMNLVKMMYTYANKMEVTDLVLACHPRHARLYERLFFFRKFGELRSYKAVNDAPAVAVRLDLTTVEELYQDAYDVDAFNLYRFYFTDDVFRCAAAALRAGAFGHEVNRTLLALQPSLIDALESACPGMVFRLTGWSRGDIHNRREAVPQSDWEAVACFVAA
jgi:hypothetical protein